MRSESAPGASDWLAAFGVPGWSGTVEFAPGTFKEVLDAALRLGRAAGRMPEAMAVVGEGERRLRALHDRLGRRRDGALAGRDTPTVVVLAAAEPLTVAGRWVPDLVEMAGGEPVALGTRPGDVAWEALRSADPDVLVLAGQPDLAPLSTRPGWDDLAAVRAGRVYAFGKAPSLLHPGPTLYDAVEKLAALLHPDLFGTA
jgi:iron complex transport system substrate-binding protein